MFKWNALEVLSGGDALGMLSGGDALGMLWGMLAGAGMLLGPSEDAFKEDTFRWGCF